MSPAAKAPRRMSRPSTWASASIDTSSRTTSRTANCALLCRVLAMTLPNQGGLGRSDQKTAAAVMAAKTASSTAD